MGTLINSRPKFVTSTTLTDPEWATTTVIVGDAVAAVERLKDDKDLRLVQNGIVIMSYRPRT